MMHHGWGMNDRNHHHTMRMLDRIMRNTSRRPRPPRPGGPGKWGGVAVDPKPQQTLGTQLVANQQLAGLAGLFDRPKVLKPEQTTLHHYLTFLNNVTIKKWLHQCNQK